MDSHSRWDDTASDKTRLEHALDQLVRDGLLASEALSRLRTAGPSLRRDRAELLRALRAGLANGEIAFVSLLRLNNLGAINQIYGPSLGDSIQELAQNVIEVVLLEHDPSAVFGRQAGAVHMILHRTDETATVCAALEKVQQAVANAALTFAGGSVRAQAVVASVEVRDPTPYSPDDVLRMLDHVRREAERSHQPVRVLAHDREQAQQRLDLEKRQIGVDFVSRALAEGRVDVHFQPVINLKTNRLYDGEALARIRNNGSFIKAGEFIDAVYNLGEIATLDAQVFARVRSSAGELAKVTDKLFVNVSPLSLASPSFLRVMRDTIASLRGQGLKLVLVLELTEQALLEHIDVVREIHREDGVTFAVDDFGTGYSSLQTVSELAVANVISHLKIDGSLTRQLPVSNEVYKVVLSIANMARSLGIKVVAEHVENDEILARLRTTGVEFGQGHVFDPALPAADLIARYPARVDEEEPRFTPRQLHVLEPYLDKAFGAFYEKLLSDPHFAVFFTSREQAKALVDRQRETFLRSLGDSGDGLRERYVKLGRLHHDLLIPFASFARGADILHEELLEVLANVTNDGVLIKNTMGFFASLKNHMARGYLDRIIAEDVLALDTLRRGLRSASSPGREPDATVFACFDGLLHTLRGDGRGPSIPAGPETCPLHRWIEEDGAAASGLLGADQGQLAKLHRAIHVSGSNLDFFVQRAEDQSALLIYRQVSGRFLMLCALLLAGAGPHHPPASDRSETR